MDDKILTVVGMGYVGMPIAIEFAKYIEVYGFDINEEKIRQYAQGIDPTDEVGTEGIQSTSLKFTSDESCIKKSNYIIVAVPTPINQDKSPNLDPIVSASKLIGRNLSKNSYVVYESTVYPGVTEDVCIPILEAESGLKCGVDFHVGYSPERINPGDKVHKLSNIKKIVAGQDQKTTDILADLYSIVVKAGVVKVSSIKTAEATKVIENSQRDINIAFMNEVAMIFNEMNIDTLEVVKAMNTKWNALGFTPGLVGGHCIGVDPYYFIYEAEKLGYHSELISTGRRINDNMTKFIAENTVNQLIKGNKKVKGANVLVLGLAFKENTPDCRNSKIANVVSSLEEYGINVKVVDPLVDKVEAKREYNIDVNLTEEDNLFDAVLLGVKHDIFAEYTLDKIQSILKNDDDETDCIIDIKGMFDKKDVENYKLNYWRL